MFSSALVVVLFGLAEVSKSPSPLWMTEYWSAQKAAKEHGKPLAVFLAPGKDGWNKVSQRGRLSEEALQVLAAEYTCVFLDTERKEAKNLAQEFSVSDGLGLVISDRTGDLQAFRHEGDLADGTLVGYLKRFADPELVVQETVTNPSTQSGRSRTFFRPVFRSSMRGC